MTLQSTSGFHHITLVVADPRRTLRFYGRVLGLRLLRRSPFDADRGSYQLYFRAGADVSETLLTFFAWPGSPRGQWGVGGVHHVALGVATPEAQLKWKRWLVERNVGVAGPFNRGYFRSIYFRDPDGHVLEIATLGPGYDVDEPMDALGRRDVTPPGAELRGARNDSAIAARTWPEPVTEISPDMTPVSYTH